MKFADVKTYIKSDCHRYLGKSNFGSVFFLYRKYPPFKVQVAHRLKKGGAFASFLGRLIMRFGSKKYWIQIPDKVEIGYGLYISHFGQIVMNENTKIGNNCNISQNFTIGSNENKAATIGDNVYIGPNVCIVEEINIGSNATIGAGSIVTKDIPENATAAGNYAKILNYNNPGRYINNKWPV